MSVPILTIRLELIEKTVALRPPLDESSSEESVQETVQHWLDSFLARGVFVDMLGGKVRSLQANASYLKIILENYGIILIKTYET